MDFLAYVLWLLDQAREEQTALVFELRGMRGGYGEGKAVEQQAVLLDRVQTLACLIRAEAVRQGLHDVTQGFPLDRGWFASQPWLKDRPRMHTEQNDLALEGAPPWPSARECDGCTAAS